MHVGIAALRADLSRVACEGIACSSEPATCCPP
jgi:hypothetical protein